MVHQPLHLAEPSAVDPALARRWRDRLAPDDQFVFLITLDLLSVVERKNPFAAIEAFGRVALEASRPVRLVVKTLNGDKRRASLQRIIDLVDLSPASDSIEIIDEFVPDVDMAAMVSAADCLVSLHRGEGLGLHLADAMWLGTPVVASRYSGNLDFMDDDTSMLIDVVLVGAVNGEGGYPDGMLWAEPDIEQAATAMLRLVSDPTLVTELAEGARARVQSLPDERSLGQSYAAALAEQ